MTFFRTEMLFFIWAVPILFLVIVYGMRRRREIIRGFSSEHGLAAIAPANVSRRRWIKNVLLMAAVNVFYLAMPMKEERVAPGGNLGRAIAAIPLYAWMVAIAGFWFLVVERHPSGLDPRIVHLRRENRERILRLLIAKMDTGEILLVLAAVAFGFFAKGVTGLGGPPLALDPVEAEVEVVIAERGECNRGVARRATGCQKQLFCHHFFVLCGAAPGSARSCAEAWRRGWKEGRRLSTTGWTYQDDCLAFDWGRSLKVDIAERALNLVVAYGEATPRCAQLVGKRMESGPAPVCWV